MDYSNHNDILSSTYNIDSTQIGKYVTYLCNQYSVNLNLHDIAGVSRIDERLRTFFAPYLYHNNPFCNYLKKFKITEKTCSRNKEILCRLCLKKNTPFYGSCYMGIEELRYPVKWNGKLIAFLCVGLFYTDLDMSLKMLEMKAVKYKLDMAECKNRFLAASKPLNFDIGRFSIQLGMLADYLSLLYGKFILNSHKDTGADKLAEQHKQNYIVSRTLEYINNNFTDDISLKILAGNCYCSEQYLSSLFNERTASTITDYIHSLRVSKAKTRLDVTSLSISEIAFECGFNDSNYFSRVFRQHTGLSPTEYRQRKI